MRIFLAGDWRTGTGPANVTKYYINNLPEGTMYQKFVLKSARAAEILFKTIRSDVVIYSGYSKQNVLGMEMAKRFNKPSIYLMHGCVEYENEINLVPDEEMKRVERKTLEMADLILAVSEKFEKWLKDYYPEHADKISHVTNGIDVDLIQETRERAVGKSFSEQFRDPSMIFTIGGGMPRKKIKHICEAIELLHKRGASNLYLTVIGDYGKDSEIIDNYGFVKNLGIVSFSEAKELFLKASVFIQNSCFETFGLAPVEAVASGCSVLLSQEVGALELFKSVTPSDIIERYDNPKEIADKIENLIREPNADRMLSDFRWELDSWSQRSANLEQKARELLERRA